jgi:cytochrome P450
MSRERPATGVALLDLDPELVERHRPLHQRQFSGDQLRRLRPEIRQRLGL